MQKLEPLIPAQKGHYTKAKTDDHEQNIGSKQLNRPFRAVRHLHSHACWHATCSHAHGVRGCCSTLGLLLHHHSLCCQHDSSNSTCIAQCTSCHLQQAHFLCFLPTFNSQPHQISTHALQSKQADLTLMQCEECGLCTVMAVEQQSSRKLVALADVPRPKGNEECYLGRVNDPGLHKILNPVIHGIVTHLPGLTQELLYNDITLNSSVVGYESGRCLPRHALSAQACADTAWCGFYTSANGAVTITSP